MKPLDYVFIAVFLIAFVAALYFTLRKKKKGGGCGSCSSCPYSSSCSAQKTQPKDKK